MSTSQNGWPGIETGSDARLVRIPKIIGRVLGGDVATILTDLVEQFDTHVEDVDLGADDWGHAFRAVRAGASLSNHASGTAIDLNALRHPLGKVGTFTASQVAALRRILARYGGVVRWGGDYSGRKDEMHFEIVGTPAQVAAVAARLRAGTTSGGSSAAKPSGGGSTAAARLDFLEALMASIPIRFFAWKSGSTTHIFEATLLTGTYRRVKSMAALRERRAALTGSGIPWQDQPGGKGEVPGYVTDASGFGVQVGD